MQQPKPIGLFHTPESMQELEKWIYAANDATVVTAAFMMYNLLTSKYDLVEKKQFKWGVAMPPESLYSNFRGYEGPLGNGAVAKVGRNGYSESVA